MLKMMRTKIITLSALAILMIMPVMLGACQNGVDSAAATPEEGSIADAVPRAESLAPQTSAAEVGTADIEPEARIADGSEQVFDVETTAELSTAEIEGLAYMRQEEKLARDVYLALDALWGVPVYQNIAGSEQAHMDSVLLLLKQYGLADPVAGLAAGEFPQPHFQSLYAELVAQGTISLADALMVGAKIEEMDIVDLRTRASQTANETIIQLYTNLMNGSENHLRAFVSNLARRTGEAYQPVYLDQAAYQAIVGGTAARGNRSGRNGNGEGRGGNGNRWQNG